MATRLLGLFVYVAFWAQSCLARVDLPDKINAVFFANWAQYRGSTYGFYPANMSDIVADLDLIYYGFAYFCPNASMFQPYWIVDPDQSYCAEADPFDIIWIEPKDPQFYAELMEFKKSANKELKVVLSVGGWNFPSNFFSEMVSSAASRAAFVRSAVNVTQTYGFDGIDIDWEYPNSAARMDPVEIYCTYFHNVSDDGGCEDDKANFVSLMKELREGLGEDMLITFCGQAGLMHVESGFDLEKLVKQVDLINIMSYDYTVSATALDFESLYTAPNEPLYQPKGVANIAQWNVNSTLNGYIEMGAPADQLLVGIAYYGHTWYIPSLTASNESTWNHYGIESMKPSEQDASNCCSILKETYGGSSGQTTLQCGFNGYYEIQAAGFLDGAIIDNETMTYISYLGETGADSWTPANTWINFQGKETVKAIVNFANDLDVRGAFGFDISTDSYENGKWTFDLTKQMQKCVKDGC